jgi:tetratricopeptide (TPR) repeat protein
MEGKRLGAYRLETALGSGGMGTVYLASAGGEGDADGEKVAVKVLHPALLSEPGSFKRFLREGELGRKIRHENVVRTLDIDALDVDGQMVHFLVMEYVRGCTLHDLRERLGTVPEALLREIAVQVAAGLAAVHEAGIVHRDIKPKNVLITDDHRIRIMDLGVARLVGASLVLTQQGQFLGSLLYAAPEQIGGEEAGPLSDLYSLGVSLYELATGVNPFEHTDPARVINAHLNDTPTPVSERVAGFSVFLSSVIMTLLAREPADRFDSAAELSDVLREGERSTWWETRREALQARGRVPDIPVRRPTPIRARRDELELLRTKWRQAVDGAGNSILLEGEAGIGKTRLLDAFLRDLPEEEAHVLYGSYAPSGGIGGLSDAVIGHFGETGLVADLGERLEKPPEVVEAFAALLRNQTPHLVGNALGGDAPHAMLCGVMRSLARERPLIWIVEDLHFAQKDSRALALSLARAVEGHRVLLVLTTRPGIADEELAHFRRIESNERVRVGRLGARDVIRLLEDALRSKTLAQRIGGKVAYKSDGVPYFVFEIVRSLRERGLIREQEDGTWIDTKRIDDIEVPSAVRDLIAGRLAAIADADRALLDVASIQGFSFDADLVARVRAEKRVFVLERLAAIERRTGVVRADGARHRFDHHQIQEVLYGSLPLALRQEYHTMLADELTARERTGPADDALPDDVATVLVSHHLRGSSPGRALPLMDRAIGHLEATFRNEGVTDLVDTALSIPRLVDETGRARFLVRKATCLSAMGEWKGAEEALRAALASAEGGGSDRERILVRRHLARHLQARSVLTEAREHVDAALELVRRTGDRTEEGSIERVLGLVLDAQGKFDEARPRYEKARDLAREAGDRSGVALAELDLGVAAYSQARLDDAERHFETSGDLARECCDRVIETKAVGNLALVHQRLGRYEEARGGFVRNLEMAREICDRPVEANATLNLALAAWNAGDFAEARDWCERARERYREIGDRRGEVVATGNLGLVSLNRGRLADAKAFFDRGLMLASDIGDVRMEGFLRENLGGLHLHLGDVEEGRRVLSQAGDILEEVGARVLHANVLQSLGEACLIERDLDGARRWCERALEARREIPYPKGVVGARVTLAEIAFLAGDRAAATEHLNDAIEGARTLGEPGPIVLATAWLCRLGEVTPEEAEDVLAGLEERLGHFDRLKAAHVLWRAAESPEHLTRARDLLREILSHAPEEARGRMREAVPIYREILSG